MIIKREWMTKKIFLDLLIFNIKDLRLKQSCTFIGRTDAEAETPILWPPDAKSWLIGKDPNAGKDWRQEEKGTTEDEMVERHHWLNENEFKQAPGVCVGQGSLVCCSPMDRQVRHNWVTELNWTESWIYCLQKEDDMLLPWFFFKVYDLSEEHLQCFSYFFIYILLAWHVLRTMRTQISLHANNTNYSRIFTASVTACNSQL